MFELTWGIYTFLCSKLRNLTTWYFNISQLWSFASSISAIWSTVDKAKVVPTPEEVVSTVAWLLFGRVPCHQQASMRCSNGCSNECRVVFLVKSQHCRLHPCILDVGLGRWWLCLWYPIYLIWFSSCCESENQGYRRVLSVMVLLILASYVCRILKVT